MKGENRKGNQRALNSDTQAGEWDRKQNKKKTKNNNKKKKTPIKV